MLSLIDITEYNVNNPAALVTHPWVVLQLAMCPAMFMLKSSREIFSQRVSTKYLKYACTFVQSNYYIPKYTRCKLYPTSRGTDVSATNCWYVNGKLQTKPIGVFSNDGSFHKNDLCQRSHIIHKWFMLGYFATRSCNPIPTQTPGITALGFFMQGLRVVHSRHGV